MLGLKQKLLPILLILGAIKKIVKILWASLRAGTLKQHLVALRKVSTFAIFHVANVLEERSQGIQDPEQTEAFLKTENIVALRKLTLGLHRLLQQKKPFRFSMLMPVYKPHPHFFKQAVRAALSQTAPDFEVILGLDGEQPEVLSSIEELKSENPELNFSNLKIHTVNREISGGGISVTTNEIAKIATGSFLFLMDHDDWIRPDLLYRYHQTLVLAKDPSNTALYCDEFKIDEQNRLVPGSIYRKNFVPFFPYLFVNSICHCFMIPTGLWKQVDGLRKITDGAQDFDLALRLDLAGAEFMNVPVLLYAWRAHDMSTAKTANQKDYATPAGILALSEYMQKKNLPWKITEGMGPTTYRAFVPLNAKPKILAVMPFYNQKELTLQAARSVMSSADVEARVVAVDNNSTDPSIAAELKTLGCEVLTISEPFNFSRINNRAACESVSRDWAEFILFINNDVVVEAPALREMASWCQLKDIGIVGCRLSYPDGSLQHGGVELEPAGPTMQMNWSHIECHRPAGQLGLTKVIRITDAVTLACAMVRKNVFFDIGLLDETHYPVAFSDTDLCARLKESGLLSLYTPFAHGIHYESQSRGLNNIEDYEASRWLYEIKKNSWRPIGQTKKSASEYSPQV